MSPFLETWYHQTDCKDCGEPLYFIQDEAGRWAPLESNGNDHRFTCPERNPPPEAPAEPQGKPKYKPWALEYEIEHEGQRTLKRWVKK